MVRLPFSYTKIRCSCACCLAVPFGGWRATIVGPRGIFHHSRRLPHVSPRLFRPGCVGASVLMHESSRQRTCSAAAVARNAVQSIGEDLLARAWACQYSKNGLTADDSADVTNLAGVEWSAQQAAPTCRCTSHSCPIYPSCLACRVWLELVRERRLVQNRAREDT